MVALYTNIPINQTIEVINHIRYPYTVMVDICLTFNFFSFEGKLYEQMCSVTMGSPLSPVVANMFMEDFKSKDLSSSQYKPKLWKRFLDETYII